MTQRNLKDLLTKQQIQQLNLGVTSVLKDLLTDEQIQYLKSVVGSLASQRFTEFRDTSDHPTMVMFRSVWEQTQQKSEKDSEEILRDFKEKNPSFADELVILYP